jgi:hypothetical protein
MFPDTSKTTTKITLNDNYHVEKGGTLYLAVAPSGSSFGYESKLGTPILEWFMS